MSAGEREARIEACRRRFRKAGRPLFDAGLYLAIAMLTDPTHGCETA